MNRAKRLVDLGLTLPGILLVSPVMVGSAIAIKLDDGGPVFFRQERVGIEGEPFRLWKFRTMRAASSPGKVQLTVGQDSRITRVGRVLRKYKIDELPQLFNVLAGEMSLVGPRPEVPRYVNHYSEAQREVLNFVPGITDPASIKFRNESDLLGKAGADAEAVYIREIMPEKLAINLEYARRATVLSDLGVIARTLLEVAR